MTTVREFDPARYMGEWHEIAKYKFKYEDDCDRAKAIYTWDENNQQILVENQCFRKGKMIRSRTGKAKITDLSDPGKLTIMFDGYPRDPTSGQYWIHWTDYHNAIVGGPSGEMLWWLSRNKTVKASEVEPMLKKIRSFGYDTDRLMSHVSVVTRD